jgi:hypothetical protein
VVAIFLFVYVLRLMCSFINYFRIIFVTSAENTLVKTYILLSVKKIFYDSEKEWENEEYPYYIYKYHTANYHFHFWNLVVAVDIFDLKRNVDIEVQIFFQKEDQDEEED